MTTAPPDETIVFCPRYEVDIPHLFCPLCAGTAGVTVSERDRYLADRDHDMTDPTTATPEPTEPSAIRAAVESLARPVATPEEREGVGEMGVPSVNDIMILAISYAVEYHRVWTEIKERRNTTTLPVDEAIQELCAAVTRLAAPAPTPDKSASHPDKSGFGITATPPEREGVGITHAMQEAAARAIEDYMNGPWTSDLIAPYNTLAMAEAALEAACLAAPVPTPVLGELALVMTAMYDMWEWIHKDGRPEDDEVISALASTAVETMRHLAAPVPVPATGEVGRPTVAAVMAAVHNFSTRRCQWRAHVASQREVADELAKVRALVEAALARPAALAALAVPDAEALLDSREGAG